MSYSNSDDCGLQKELQQANTNALKAVQRSEVAFQQSIEALDKANESVLMSKNIQEQLNTLVIEAGETSRQVLQAFTDSLRETAEVSKEVLDNKNKRIDILENNTGKRYNLNEFGDCYGEGKYADEAFAKLLDTFNDTNNGSIIIISKSIKIRKTINIDLKNMSFEFINQAVIDASEVDSRMPAMLIFKGDKWNYIKNMTIQGANKQGVGVLFENKERKDTVSHVSFINCEINNFNECLQIGTNAYILRFYNCGFWTCVTGIHMLSNGFNYGENICFISCIIGGKVGVLQENPDGYLHLLSCSIDLVDVFIDAKDGKVYCSMPHFETSPTGDGTAYFYTRSNNSAIHISGGTLITSNPFQKKNMDYLFHTEQNAFGGIYIDSFFVHNLNTKSGFLCGGTGLIYINSIIRSEFNSGSTFLSANHNKLCDPNFVNPTPLDFAIVRGFSNSPTSNSHLNLANNKDGTMKVSMKGDVNWNTEIGVLFPVDRLLYGVKMKTKNVENLTGLIVLKMYFLKVNGYDIYGNPRIIKSETKISQVAKDASVSNDFTISGLNTLRNQQRPEWATHVMFSLALSTRGIGSFDIYDVFVGSCN
ncbi:hypothetical protein ABEX55_05715 [Priestia endophytica]|uniref:hypothetical protein n=1 Tax=Priestia endophytica TaxID=135735 RepID=UPI003D2CC06E